MSSYALQCPECGAPRMELVRTPKRVFYRCTAFPECLCTHGAHPDGSQLGLPGDRATRQARVRAHYVFDALWKTGRMTRKQSYGVLQKIMRKTECEGHIGMFTREECERLVREIITLGGAIDILVDRNDNTE